MAAALTNTALNTHKLSVMYYLYTPSNLWVFALSLLRSLRHIDFSRIQHDAYLVVRM